MTSEATQVPPDTGPSMQDRLVSAWEEAERMQAQRDEARIWARVWKVAAKRRMRADRVLVATVNLLAERDAAERYGEEWREFCHDNHNEWAKIANKKMSKIKQLRAALAAAEQARDAANSDRSELLMRAEKAEAALNVEMTE